jgi:PAS domain S-box-containing protein
VIITSRDGTITWVNTAFSETTGYSAAETIGKNPRSLLKSGVHDAAFYKPMWDTLLSGNVWHGEMTNRRKDGSHYPEDLTITPVKDAHGDIAHFVAIKRDLTAEKALQAQFLQAQKMESVGQLAGGIAHDFNNLLTVINSTAELAAMGLSEDDSMREELLTIGTAGTKAAALTRQLLAFSRQQILQPAVISLNSVVLHLEGMLRRVISENIELVIRLDDALSNVSVDPGQIEQVIINLVINSRDAMPNGGQVIIETRNIALDETFASTHAAVRPGPHVMLAISDTGVGMNQATQLKIFEPFFTTKDPAKGTGLGLSTAYGIVKQSGGDIQMYSEVGHGTTIKIYLPRVGGESRESEAARPLRAERGTETILVVDDAVEVCSMAKRVLERAGYTVLAAGSGVEALSLLDHREGPVHLMLTDMVMPGMSGRELSERIATSQPDTKILYTSGYTSDVIVQQGVLDHGLNFIGKPYAISALMSKVREVLDS